MGGRGEGEGREDLTSFVAFCFHFYIYVLPTCH